MKGGTSGARSDRGRDGWREETEGERADGWRDGRRKN